MRLRLRNLLILSLLLWGHSLYAQGSRYDGVVQGSRGTIAGATIAVCTQPAVTSTTPCSPLASIFSNVGLSTPLTNPTVSDVNGNYHFYIAPGTYTIQIYGAQIATPYILADQTIGISTATNATNLVGPGAITGNYTHSGTETFTGKINCTNIGNSRCVDDANTQGWTGSDIGGWINSAYSACPTGTCSITIYSGAGANVNFSTPITFTTLGKNVNLYCATPSNATATGGLVLQYTPTTATSAITIDNAALSGTMWIPQEIRGCTFVNSQPGLPGTPCATQGGCASSANGIASGTTNGGMGWLKLVNSSILGFGNNILLQNSTGGWGVDCDNSTLGVGTIGLNITSAQEVFHLTKCRLMSNGRGIKSTVNGDIVAVQNQFDSNATFAVDLSSATGGMFQSIGNHYENFNVPASATDCNYVTSQINNYISGGTVLNDITSGTTCNFFFHFFGSSSSTIDGVAIGSPNQAVTNAFLIDDPHCVYFTILQTSTLTKTQTIGGSTTCAPVGTLIAKGSANQKNPSYFSDGAQGAPGIAYFNDALTGFARVGAGNVQYVSAGSDGTLLNNVELRQGNLGRFNWSSNADAANAAADTGLSRDAAGVVDVGIGTSGNSAGSLKSAALIAGGSAAGLTGTGACATITTQTGGAWAGRATCTGTTGASTFVISPGTTAPNGWVCSAFDETTRANLLQQTATLATNCTLTATSVTQNDVIVFRATAF